MYFQYDTSGTPFGFIFNGTQYFYMTNQMGDVFAITEADGEILCVYAYDEWGKLLGISCADDNDAQQVAVANLNPLRYRGYYYDSETEYYYLQSRYYDPSICRFINADVPEIAQLSKNVAAGTNLFAYCNNEPVNNKDLDGHIAANIIGAIIGGLIGAIGGYFLTRWLADKLHLSGWKRVAFIAGLTVLITASAAAIGYFIAPYIVKFSKRIFDSLKPLIKKSCCFVAGTKISTPNGLVSIEDIKLGDIVYAENSNTGEKGEKRVTNIFVSQTNTLYHIITNNDTISTTEEHPFWVDGIGWKPAKDLTVGDRLCLQNGETIIVRNIFVENLDTPQNVYNFEVEDWHTYFVGNSNILVHNKCNLNKINDSFLKRKGFNAHSIKREVLGSRAKISQYNLYVDKESGAIFILQNGAKVAERIATGYFIK